MDENNETIGETLLNLAEYGEGVYKTISLPLQSEIPESRIEIQMRGTPSEQKVANDSRIKEQSIALYLVEKKRLE